MLRVLYAGSPEPAAITLKLLLQNAESCGFEIVGVLTNPPASQGRHKDLIPTPVQVVAQENNLPFFTPDHLDGECRDQISPLKADILVCFAYGHIFGPKFLGLFPLGGMNLHPSLLPKYRGCTPVNAAILNRDEKTAATIQTLSLGMDEGDILAQKVIHLDGTETAESLLKNSAEIGAELIASILKNTAEKGAVPKGEPQSGEASYTGIITKAHGKIDWSKSAVEIEAALRAYTPEPGIWTTENTGTPKENTLKIIKAKVGDEASVGEKVVALGDAAEIAGKQPGTVLAFVKPEGIYVKCGTGVLCVTELQRQGKKAMAYKDFMNGAGNFIGSVLG